MKQNSNWYNHWSQRISQSHTKKFNLLIRDPDSSSRWSSISRIKEWSNRITTDSIPIFAKTTSSWFLHKSNVRFAWNDSSIKKDMKQLTNSASSALIPSKNTFAIGFMSKLFQNWKSVTETQSKDFQFHIPRQDYRWIGKLHIGHSITRAQSSAEQTKEDHTADIKKKSSSLEIIVFYIF